MYLLTGWCKQMDKTIYQFCFNGNAMIQLQLRIFELLRTILQCHSHFLQIVCPFFVQAWEVKSKSHLSCRILTTSQTCVLTFKTLMNKRSHIEFVNWFGFWYSFAFKHGQIYFNSSRVFFVCSSRNMKEKRKYFSIFKQHTLSNYFLGVLNLKYSFPLIWRCSLGDCSRTEPLLRS